jgi:hypothetical protein
MKIAAALLSLLALGLAQPASAAAAATRAPASGQAVIDANNQLAARIAETPAGQPVPMLSNNGASLVRAAYDAAAIRAVPLDDAMTIGGICQALGNSIIAYTNAIERETQGDTAKANAATVRLQDEFTLGTVASIVCGQRGFRSIDGLIAPLSASTLIDVLPALELMRTGYGMILEGSLEMLAIEGFTPANKALIVAALNEDNGVVAASYPTADRRRRGGMVREAMGRLAPSLRPGLSRLARSFDAPDCNHICQAGTANAKP